MLAGLQSTVDSLFPALRDLTPSEEELKEGERKLKFGRVVEISGYKTEIFDTQIAKDRKAYADRMLDLSKKAQVGKVRIFQHDRQILSRKDGTTGWFIYLEWAEYERKDGDKPKG